MPVAHRSFFIRRPDRFQMLRQGCPHFWDGSAAQPLLLGPSPRIGLGGLAVRCRAAQILPDMKEIAQKGSLLSKHFPGLQLEPSGPVSHPLNATFHSPPSLPRAVAPTRS